ncbi:MAG: glycosyltransferase family 2 protein [Rhodothermaceae bacterium]|nr:glycosyltransferase family 2 protein [Rhodothermaceae bacterium]
MRTVIIIPAFNEARSIGRVLGDLPAEQVGEVVVVNNASTDETEANARVAGATVLREDRQGYGYACLRGLAYVRELAAQGRTPEVVVFLDGDYSDHPDELPTLLAPIEQGLADLVIGSRILGRRHGRVEPGAMLPQALVGNRVACALIRLFWGVRFTDLGPFRAIRYPALLALGMEDRTWGWTVEMQIKAARAGLRCTEVPVSYRRRIGVSKITGTLSGTLKASWKILWTIARFALTPRPSPGVLESPLDSSVRDVG